MFTVPECVQANLTELEQQLLLLIFLLGKTHAHTLAQVLHQLPQDAGLRPVRMKEPEVDRLLGKRETRGMKQSGKMG